LRQGLLLTNQPLRKVEPKQINQPLRKVEPKQIKQPLRKVEPKQINQPFIKSGHEPLRKVDYSFLFYLDKFINMF